MGFSQTKLLLVLLQLSLLSLSSYSFLFDFGRRHRHNHPRPCGPPLSAPTQSPAVNPLTLKLAMGAATPPTSPRSDRVAVQGDVYCMNCTGTIGGAKPLRGAAVVVTCMSGFFPTVRFAMTDKDGHFLIMLPAAVKSSAAASQCTAYLFPVPPLGRCSQRASLNGGVSGAHLKAQETFAPLPYSLFTVGPLAFEPPRRFCSAGN